MTMTDPLRILVVDDDLDICRATCRVLESALYVTSSASNGAEALELLRTHPPDLALLDRQLPDRDGLEICRQIKTAPATTDLVFVVMISAHQIQSAAQLEALELGADGYITRPVSNRELLTRIEAFARIIRLTRKLTEQTMALLALEVELEQRVKDRTAELLTANRKLAAAQRAAFSLLEDATRSQKQLARANEELRQEIAQREQTEATLRASEARYRLLAENGSDVIWLMDLRTQRFTYTSPAVVKIRGFTPEEVSQHTLAETLTPESCQKVATVLPARLAAFVAGDDSVRTQTDELDMFRRDGSIVPTEVVSTLVTDEHRQVTHIQGITRDLTERRRAEAELRASEERFRAYIEQAADAVFVHDAEGRFVEVNQRACQSLGYSPSELLGMGLFEVEQDFTLATAKAAWAQMQPGRGRILLGHQRRKDGTTFPVEAHLGSFDLHGQRMYLALARDITERHQTEERAESLRKLGFALTTNSDLPATLRLCLDTAMKVGGMDAGGIYLAEEPSGDLQLVCHAGLSTDFVAAVAHFPADSANARWARAGGFFHSHARMPGRPTPSIEEQEGLRALSLLPVHYLGRLLAVLNVTSHTVDEVPPAARVALDTVAGLLGGLLHRLRAKDHLTRHAVELQARNDELSRFNRLAVGREVRMIELKQEVNQLCATAGLPERYSTSAMEHLAQARNPQEERI